MCAQVIVALGSNQGDRAALLAAALAALPKAGVTVRRVSSLYETAPAYVTDQVRPPPPRLFSGRNRRLTASPLCCLAPAQPTFLNAAVSCTTSLEPVELLAALKRIEADCGRTAGGQASHGQRLQGLANSLSDFACAPAPPIHPFSQRYGPRPIDLDIIAYGNRTVELPHLQVPHPRVQERPFVLAPVADLAADEADPAGPACRLAAVWTAQGGESRVGRKGLQRVLPLPRGLVLPVGGETHLMGVINVTPDSFSDGGDAMATSDAVAAALDLASAGARVIDVGGQSTRPGAQWVPAAEELRRVRPVIEQLRERLPPEVVISVDTFYGSVAAAAVSAGAHLVNDVSGGRWDPDLLGAVAASGAAYVATHSRGTPETMQSAEHTAYPAGLIQQVSAELRELCRRAEAAGIEPWRIMIDPGLGFAKGKDANLQLLRGLCSIRGSLPHAPMLIGPSRKGFLGMLTNGKPPKERDWATAAAVGTCVAGGAAMVRVHNVRAMRDVVAVADAIYRLEAAQT